MGRGSAKGWEPLFDVHGKLWAPLEWPLKIVGVAILIFILFMLYAQVRIWRRRYWWNRGRYDVD
jgi:hypothetical protein